MAGKFASLFFRARVMKVLRLDLQFKPNLRGPRKVHFRAMCEAVLNGGGNEYDAACIYLLDHLDRWQRQETGLSKAEKADYLQEKRAQVETLLPKTRGLAEKRFLNSQA